MDSHWKNENPRDHPSHLRAALHHRLAHLPSPLSSCIGIPPSHIPIRAFSCSKPKRWPLKRSSVLLILPPSLSLHTKVITVLAHFQSCPLSASDLSVPKDEWTNTICLKTNGLKPEILGKSDDHLADASGSGIDAQGIVDGLLIGFDPCGLAHVQDPPVPTPEGHRHPLLPFQDAP